MGTMISVALLALGGYLTYSGFAQKSPLADVLKDGETMNDLMNKDANTLIKRQRTAMVGALGKSMKICIGIMLLIAGLIALALTR
jgi:hypothetical protein